MKNRVEIWKSFSGNSVDFSDWTIFESIDNFSISHENFATEKSNKKGLNYYQALASLALINPPLAAPKDEMMKFLMSAGRGGIALWAALVPSTSSFVAVASGFSTSDNAIVAVASSAWIARWYEGVSVGDFSSLVPTTLRVNRACELSIK